MYIYRCTYTDTHTHTYAHTWCIHLHLQKQAHIHSYRHKCMHSNIADKLVIFQCGWSFGTWMSNLNIQTDCFMTTWQEWPSGLNMFELPSKPFTNETLMLFLIDAVNPPAAWPCQILAKNPSGQRSFSGSEVPLAVDAGYAQIETWNHTFRVAGLFKTTAVTTFPSCRLVRWVQWELVQLLLSRLEDMVDGNKYLLK